MNNIEELKKNNYLLTEKGDRLHSELILHDVPIASLVISYENKIPVGSVSINGVNYTLRLLWGIWPKRFEVIQEKSGNKSILKFNLFGFSGKMIWNNVEYKLAVDPGARGLQSHNVWRWQTSDGTQRKLELNYAAGTHPDGIQSIAIDEITACVDGPLLALFAQYLLVVYVRGH